MSAIVDDLRAYAAAYGLRRRDELRLLCAYPAFRAAYEREHAHGLRRRAAIGLSRRLARVTITHRSSGPGGSVLVPLRLGAADLASFREILLDGAYDLGLDGVGTYVDVGANTGMAAAFFATRFPLRRSLLIEANPRLIPQLQRVARGLPHTAAVEHVAIAAQPGTIAFNVSENHRLSGVGVVHGTPAPVAAEPLRAVLDRHGLRSVDLLKIDIEGAEHDVLASDPEVLAGVGALVMELHNARDARDATADLVRRHGFTVEVERGTAVDLLVGVRR